MKFMRTIIFISVGIIFGCRSSSIRADKSVDLVKHRVYECYENWTFHDLTDTIEIRLLLQDEKGRYSMAKWPNFYIGINLKGDTIGVVERINDKKFDKNTILKFAPFEGNKDLDRQFTLTPVLKISKKESENDLYCSVNRIFYGNLIE